MGNKQACSQPAEEAGQFASKQRGSPKQAIRELGQPASPKPGKQPATRPAGQTVREPIGNAPVDNGVERRGSRHAGNQPTKQASTQAAWRRQDTISNQVVMS